MKKIIIPFLLTSILNVNTTNSEEPFFVNTNGVRMSESVLNTLLSMGYTEREIKYMTQNEYDDKKSLQIYSVKKDEYVIKTSNVIKDEKIVSFSDEIITKEVAIEEISIAENQQNLMTADVSKQEYIEDEYKEIVVYSVLTKNQLNIYNFFVKINVDWITTPNNYQRGTDYIAIKTLNNVNVIPEIIDGNSYPKLSSKFIYTKDVYYYEYNYINNPVQNIGTYEIVNTIKGNNIDQYLYDMGEGIAVCYDLPEDIHESVSELLYIKINEVTCSDFFFTLSANFTPAYSDITSTSFAGIYAHQKNSIPLLTGLNITFTDNNPFISIGSNNENSYQMHVKNLFYNEEDFMWPMC